MPVILYDGVIVGHTDSEGGNAKSLLGGLIMKRGKVTVVMDAQAGSCGKGKFIGYMACNDRPVAAINNFMSNAGHTFVTSDGHKIMTQHLPTSIVNGDVSLFIGPGAAITLEILMDELDRYENMLGKRKINIHPRAMLINEGHRDREARILRSGSTFKGCGAAQADKIMRTPGIQLFGDWMKGWYPSPPDSIRVVDTAECINGVIDSGGDVLVEGSQGFDLDINYGLNYPHTTSRQCHAGQLLADCGISPRLVTDIFMIMRPYPIRISNKTDIGMDISSGDYAGADEITWDTVKERCGAPDDIEFGEMTTVTKKQRRVFEMNWDRLKYAATINRPTGIILNFAQYIDWDAYCVTQWCALPGRVKTFIKRIELETGCPVVMIGTGPRNCHIVDLREDK